MSKTARRLKTIWRYLAALAIASFACVSLRAKADIIYFSRNDGVLGTIYRLDPATGVVSPVVSGAPANSINYPFALALGPDGNIYVGNLNNGTIVKVTPGGTASNYVTGLSLTSGVCFDPVGNFYASQITIGSISKIPPASGAPVTFASGLATPARLRSDPDGNIYTVLANTTTVQKITQAGGISTFSSSEPAAIFWTPSGDLYQSTLTSITKTTPSGAITTVASGFISADPIGVGSAGDVYVYDDLGHYATGGGMFYDISPWGAVSAIADAPFAIDYLVAAPEPSGLVLMGWAAYLSLWRPMRNHARDPQIKSNGPARTCRGAVAFTRFRSPHWVFSAERFGCPLQP